jgi:lysophospholipase L1-like esterase
VVPEQKRSLMIKKSSRLLLCSLTLNAIFLGMGAVTILRKGGTSYVVGKIAPTPTPTPLPPTRYIDSALYRTRQEIFAAMPRQESPTIFAGDSLTARCPWDELLERPVLNRGIDGDILEGLQARSGEILARHPRQLFLMIGINDLIQGSTETKLAKQYEEFLAQIRTRSPQTEIYVFSILPVNASVRKDPSFEQLTPKIIRFNQMLRTLASQKNATFIDVHAALVNSERVLDHRLTPDGLHLNAAGYQRWRKVLTPYLASR